MRYLKTIYGVVGVPESPNNDLITTMLDLYGEWSYSESLIASSIARAGDRFWDIGAHLGTFTLGLSNKVDLGSVLAVEPNSDLWGSLRSNLNSNLSIPLHFSKSAVASHSGFGILKFPDAANRGMAEFHLYDSHQLPSNDTTVAMSLMELRGSFGDYDYIKLDIEGMETDALYGDFNFISTNKPVVWAECNENHQSLLLLDLMFSLGYSPVYVAYPSIRIDNFKDNSDLLFPMAYEAALVGASPERLEALSTAAVKDVCIVRPISCKDDLLHALWDTPRWAQEDWVRLSTPELIARIGRLERREQFSTFLGAESCDVLGQEESSQIDSLAFEAKMFWRSVWSEKDNGYAEERSNAVIYAVDGKRQTIQLNFPDLIAPLTRIRLDILNAFGVLDVHDLRLLDPSGKPIWVCSGDLSIFKNHIQLALLPEPTSGVFCTLVSLGADPQVELNLPDEVYSRIKCGCTIALEVTAYRLLDRLPLVVEQLMNCSTIPSKWTEQISFASNPGLSLVPTQLANELVSIKELVQASLSQRDKVISQQNIQLNRFRDELTRAEAQLDLLKDLMLGERVEDSL